jgi:hypothetical protein
VDLFENYRCFSAESSELPEIQPVRGKSRSFGGGLQVAFHALFVKKEARVGLLATSHSEFNQPNTTRKWQI